MIKNITEQLKKDLQKYESIPERIEALKDSYKGETCYIVSAGASLKNYEPEFFSVIDVSEQHRGHQNFKENVESHFEIIIVSEKFKNLNRIERHRMVNQSLKDEFLSDLHSVVLKTYTSEEYKLI